MSRVKQIKESPDNIINLYDILSLFSPEGKSKYVETLLRIVKKTNNLNEHGENVKSELFKEFNINKTRVDNFNPLQLAIINEILGMLFNVNDLKTFQKFCDFNERGLIKQNDLSRYNTIQEIEESVTFAETIVQNKEMEKQIKIIYQDDEWLLLRPLTYQSSKKYGSNTKWCTTFENSDEYFIKYSKKGVLIYCINKLTGYKVASFYSLDEIDPEFSFWDQIDVRIDSLQTKLTPNLREIIFNECTADDVVSNYNLLPSNNIESNPEKGIATNVEYRWGSRRIAGYHWYELQNDNSHQRRVIVDTARELSDDEPSFMSLYRTPITNLQIEPDVPTSNDIVERDRLEDIDTPF